MKTLKNIASAFVVWGAVGVVDLGWGTVLALSIVLGEARKLRDRLCGDAR